DSSRHRLRRGLGGRGLRGAGACGDLPTEVGGVVVDEAEQGRAACVLPRQSQEVQAGNVSDAAPVDYLPVADHAGNADPGVVGTVAGRPDDDAGIQAAAVGEADSTAVRAGDPRPEPDPSCAEPAAAAADDEVAARHPPA